MKPTKEQIELCNYCKGVINTWINTNDINSPTHLNDIEDCTIAEFLDCPEDFVSELVNNLQELYWTVVKRGKTDLFKQANK